MNQFWIEWLKPDHLFFPPYLISALIIALFWMKFNFDFGLLNNLKLVFSKSNFSFESLRLDFILTSINIICFSEIFSRIYDFIFQLIVSLKVPSLNLSLPKPISALGITFFVMLGIDFSSYLSHRLLHHWTWLWEIHSVHHGAEKLNPLTTHRQHPFEPLFLNFARAIGAGTSFAIWRWLFPEAIPVITIYGLGAGFFFYMFTVHLHHFMIPVHYPKILRRLLISPHIHHLHHSQSERHYNCNYGIIFSFWDRFFNTYLDEKIEYGELKFGVSDQGLASQSLRKNLQRPLRLN